ncbi:hypothetical protein, partial [Deinococcus misasensis]|uniref:hypothetical protein n=1 Tax=Deinococcus misasensis TaxID=392413 RepID=UPI000557884B
AKRAGFCGGPQEALYAFFNIARMFRGNQSRVDAKSLFGRCKQKEPSALSVQPSARRKVFFQSVELAKPDGAWPFGLAALESKSLWIRFSLIADG